jgi:hypothetical protein
LTIYRFWILLYSFVFSTDAFTRKPVDIAVSAVASISLRPGGGGENHREGNAPLVSRSAMAMSPVSDGPADVTSHIKLGIVGTPFYTHSRKYCRVLSSRSRCHRYSSFQCSLSTTPRPRNFAIVLLPFLRLPNNNWSFKERRQGIRDVLVLLEEKGQRTRDVMDVFRVVAVAKGVMIEHVRGPYVIPRFHEIVKVVTRMGS